MNLYLLERTDRVGYDQYDAIIVCAKTKNDALKMNPGDSHWNPEKNISCRYIGIAGANVERGIILDSFRAG